MRKHTHTGWRFLQQFVIPLLLAMVATAAAAAEPQQAGLPKVLLIGDSISMQYMPYVVEELEGKALVQHSQGNSGPTMRGMVHLDKWLGDTGWDVIHFNFGLWDMYGWRYMEVDRSPKAYAERLETLVLRLKETGAKLIWATTTPICPGPERQCKRVIDPELEKQYLDAALRVMKKHGIAINDLYALTKPRRSEWALGANDVHFNAEGRKAHAKQVAEHIMLAASEKKPAPPNADLPQVLIIGDSISSGYTPHVVEMLKGEANVQRTMGNAQHTRNGLKHLDKWLGETQWDVIHFNWGLWDLCYRHPESKVQGRRDKVNGTVTTPLDEYEKNLDKLVSRLKKTNAKLIWANISCVPEKEAGRFVGDDRKYNEAAARIMKKYDVRINDLNTLTSGFPVSLFKGPGDVHYTTAGYKKLAEQVALEMRVALKEIPSKNKGE
jgi:lysophospholipase L1-like esterase